MAKWSFQLTKQTRSKETFKNVKIFTGPEVDFMAA